MMTKLGDTLEALIQESITVELEKHNLIKLAPHERDRIKALVQQKIDLLNVTDLGPKQ